MTADRQGYLYSSNYKVTIKHTVTEPNSKECDTGAVMRLGSIAVLLMHILALLTPHILQWSFRMERRLEWVVLTLVYIG